MNKVKLLLVFLSIVGLIWGCQSTQPKVNLEGKIQLPPGSKVHVEEVANDTKEILDVDVIGLFWDALNLALRKKSLLWLGEPGVRPLQLQAHVLKYKKGNAVQRWTMPGFGSTVLDARIDLKDGDRLLGSIAVHRTVATGDGLTRGGWRKVFTDAAEDAITALLTNSAP